MNTIPAIHAAAVARRPVMPSHCRARAGLWEGLVTGEHGVKHRGTHAVVYCEPMTDEELVLCITGPADNPKSIADAEKIARLWNQNL